MKSSYSLIFTWVIPRSYDIVKERMRDGFLHCGDLKLKNNPILVLCSAGNECNAFISRCMRNIWSQKCQTESKTWFFVLF